MLFNIDIILEGKLNHTMYINTAHYLKDWCVPHYDLRSRADHN